MAVSLCPVPNPAVRLFGLPLARFETQMQDESQQLSDIQKEFSYFL